MSSMTSPGRTPWTPSSKLRTDSRSPLTMACLCLATPCPSRYLASASASARLTTAILLASAFSRAAYLHAHQAPLPSSSGPCNRLLPLQKHTYMRVKHRYEHYRRVAYGPILRNQARLPDMRTPLCNMGVAEHAEELCCARAGRFFLIKVGY